jgi:hypothetical protein
MTIEQEFMFHADLNGGHTLAGESGSARQTLVLLQEAFFQEVRCLQILFISFYIIIFHVVDMKNEQSSFQFQTPLENIRCLK